MTVIGSYYTVVEIEPKMKSTHEISVAVRIPDDYVHEYRFLGKHGVLIIHRGSNGGLAITEIGRISKPETSPCMDWMQEVIEQIRTEVGW